MRRDLSFARMVGARMRDLRLAKGLSLVQLHKRGAPTPGQMSAIENGKVDFTLDTIHHVARALDMRPFQMLVRNKRLASLDLGEAKRILFVNPDFVLPEPSTKAPRAKPWHWKKKQRATKGGR